jgi:acetylornithine/N-succinyldiaminopimelate aminotransferase
MAVAKVVIDIVSDEAFLEHVRQVGLYMKQRLAALVDTHPGVVAEVRGEGLLAGLRCVAPVADVVTAMRDAGILGAPAGENVVRLLPPLVITNAEVDEAVARLEKAFVAVEGAQPVAKAG